jgi:hypothetical protein
MRDCQGKLSHRWSLLCLPTRAWAVVYLVFLLAVGQPFNDFGLRHMHRLLVESETVPSEESTDTELVAPRSAGPARLARKRAPVPQPTVLRVHDHDPSPSPVLHRLTLRQPNLPCGVTVPLRC